MLIPATETYARVSNQSTDVIEHILCYEGCNVDPINKIEGATPLHLAVKLESRETREYFVKELLDAGAAYTCVCLLRCSSTVTVIQIRDLGAG